MAGNVAFRNLLDQALDAHDPYLAAACHPWADCRQRCALETILFATAKLRRQFAAAMYTPPSVLDSLARNGEQRIRLRVAKHPAAGAVTLVKLARLALAEAADDLCVRLAGHRNTPRDILESLYKCPVSAGIRHALCYNLRTPLPLLRRLAVGATPVELKGIACNQEADETLLRLCWASEDEYLQAEVAAHPDCPTELLDAAEHAPQTLVRRKLAQNPALRDSVLIRLLSDTEAQVRAAAVRHLSTPIMAELDADAFDPSHRVRRDQARHNGLPRAWVSRLAGDSDSWVRRLVARNRAVPVEALHNLAGDAVMEVRRSVARNPACSASLLQILARDLDPWVRAGVALRHDIAESLIIALSRDRDIDVLSALAKNPQTPPNILDRISCHHDRDVRRAVILNRSTPRRVLYRLLEDPYPLNRVLLSSHHNLDNTDLRKLLHDPEPTVRFAGAQTASPAPVHWQRVWREERSLQVINFENLGGI